jgi:hypothetical protein
MLLREMDQGGDFVGSLETALNLYLSNANDTNGTVTIDYGTLTRLMARVDGFSGKLNKDIIGQAKTKSDALMTMIHAVGNDGITLSTNAEPGDENEMPTPDLEKTDQGISKTTQQAASSAAQSSLAN